MQRFADCLGDEQAVKRIGVVERQVGNEDCVPRPDRQLLEVVFLNPDGGQFGIGHFDAGLVAVGVEFGGLGRIWGVGIVFGALAEAVDHLAALVDAFLGSDAGLGIIDHAVAVGIGVLGDHATLHIAAAGVALSPLIQWASQEARMYELLFLAGLMSTAFLVLAVRENRPRLWAGYLAWTLIGVFTHYFFAFLLAGQVIYYVFGEVAERESIARRAGRARAKWWKPWGLFFDVDTLGPWFLWRLLIDERHQRRGIGRATLGLVMDLIRAEGATELLTSYHTGEGEPWPFYQKLGFRPTGALDHDEVVLSLDLG